MNMSSAKSLASKFGPVIILLSALAINVIYIGWIKSEKDAAEQQQALLDDKVNDLQDIITQQSQSVKSLLDLREKDYEVLSGLSARFQSIEREMTSLQRARNEIKATNDEVKNYLNAPVPAELRSLYNATGKGGNANKD